MSFDYTEYIWTLASCVRVTDWVFPSHTVKEEQWMSLSTVWVYQSVAAVFIPVFSKLSSSLSSERVTRDTGQLTHCTYVTDLMDHCCRGNPCNSAMSSKVPCLIWHLATRWRSAVVLIVFHQLRNRLKCLPLFVLRCGTTLWQRRQRTGLMPACGSTGHLTSSGSSVRTSPSGQDGEWPLTSPPSPSPDICCSS